MEHLGEASRTPYALIFSEVPEQHEKMILNSLKALPGAAGYSPEWIHVTSLEVEL